MQFLVLSLIQGINSKYNTYLHLPILFNTLNIVAKLTITDFTPINLAQALTVQ